MLWFIQGLSFARRSKDLASELLKMFPDRLTDPAQGNAALQNGESETMRPAEAVRQEGYDARVHRAGTGPDYFSPNLTSMRNSC